MKVPSRSTVPSGPAAFRTTLPPEILLICSTRACSAAARTAAVALSRACCLEFMKVPQPAMAATRTKSAPPATSRTGTAGLQTHLAGGGVEPGGNYGLYAVNHTMAARSCAINSATDTVATRVDPSTWLVAELGGVLVWIKNCDRRRGRFAAAATPIGGRAVTGPA